MKHGIDSVTNGADSVMAGGIFHGMEEEGVLEPFDLGPNLSCPYTSLGLGQMTQPWIFHLYLKV